MHSETATDESDAPVSLLSPFDKNRFTSAVRRLHTLFEIYANTCPAPIPTPELIVTPEIRTQCERYLPIADITAIYNHLYVAALTYPPILSSTPFHNSLSWADTFAALPKQFQFSANPARLLESLLADDHLLTRFLFASFLPSRFYGGVRRYPGQQQFVRDWLKARETGTLHCLDAACGTGEDTYGLALLLLEEGFAAEMLTIDGWTLEPLEVWTATKQRFPHDRRRESMMRQTTSVLFDQGFRTCIHFNCVDLTAVFLNTPSLSGGRSSGNLFDLIFCNGLLGGPIIHDKQQLDRVVDNLVRLLAPGGILLAANNFHDGWKRKYPQTALRALFHEKGLETFEAGEGIGGHLP